MGMASWLCVTIKAVSEVLSRVCKGIMPNIKASQRSTDS